MSFFLSNCFLQCGKRPSRRIVPRKGAALSFLGFAFALALAEGCTLIPKPTPVSITDPAVPSSLKVEVSPSSESWSSGEERILSVSVVYPESPLTLEEKVIPSRLNVGVEGSGTVILAEKEFSPESGTVSWSIPSIAVGSGKVSFRCEAILPDGSTISNPVPGNPVFEISGEYIPRPKVRYSLSSPDELISSSCESISKGGSISFSAGKDLFLSPGGNLPSEAEYTLRLAENSSGEKDPKNEQSGENGGEETGITIERIHSDEVEGCLPTWKMNSAYPSEAEFVLESSDPYFGNISTPFSVSFSGEMLPYCSYDLSKGTIGVGVKSQSFPEVMGVLTLEGTVYGHAGPVNGKIIKATQPIPLSAASVPLSEGVFTPEVWDITELIALLETSRYEKDSRGRIHHYITDSISVRIGISFPTIPSPSLVKVPSSIFHQSGDWSGDLRVSSSFFVEEYSTKE